MLEQFNTSTVLFLNDILRHHYFLTRVVQGLADNAFARGAPVFIPLLVIWFSDEKRRGRILSGLIGVCLATGGSVIVQRFLHIGTRPFLDPNLHLYLLNGEFADNWYHSNSFPSDTAALFFSLSTVVFLQWRAAGLVAYTWSLLINVCRMAIGFHYPTDVLAGIALGVGVVYLFSDIPRLTDFLQGFMERSKSRMPWINALLAMFIADAYTLFLASRGFVHFAQLLLARH